MENKFRLPIGDWSKDGHCHNIDLIFESNYTVEEMQKAYKASCKLSGLQFNHNEDYTGLKKTDSWGDKSYTDRLICVDYEQNELSEFAIETLRSFGLVAEERYDDPKPFADLILRFISLSMPKDFKYQEVSEKKLPALNGWWNDKLNVQFGYGIMGE